MNTTPSASPSPSHSTISSTGEAPIQTKLQIHNRQTILPLAPTALRRLLRALLRLAFSSPPPPLPPARLALLLVDDASMPAYKARAFGRPLQTDVLSLRYLPLPGAPPGGEAELIVNAQLALRQGRRRPGGPPHELALYIAHGIDHLTGANDASPIARRQMRRRELAWLQTLAPLLPPLLPHPPPA